MSTVTVNNVEVPLPANGPVSAARLLTELDLAGKTVVVKVNGKLIKKSQRGSQILNPGDIIEAIPLIGGG